MSKNDIEKELTYSNRFKIEKGNFCNSAKVKLIGYGILQCDGTVSKLTPGSVVTLTGDSEVIIQSNESICVFDIIPSNFTGQPITIQREENSVEYTKFLNAIKHNDEKSAMSLTENISAIKLCDFKLILSQNNMYGLIDLVLQKKLVALPQLAPYFKEYSYTIVKLLMKHCSSMLYLSELQAIVEAGHEEIIEELVEESNFSCNDLSYNVDYLVPLLIKNGMKEVAKKLVLNCIKYNYYFNVKQCLPLLIENGMEEPINSIISTIIKKHNCCFNTTDLILGLIENGMKESINSIISSSLEKNNYYFNTVDIVLALIENEMRDILDPHINTNSIYHFYNEPVFKQLIDNKDKHIDEIKNIVQCFISTKAMLTIPVMRHFIIPKNDILDELVHMSKVDFDCLQFQSYIICDKKFIQALLCRHNYIPDEYSMTNIKDNIEKITTLDKENLNVAINICNNWLQISKNQKEQDTTDAYKQTSTKLLTALQGYFSNDYEPTLTVAELLGLFKGAIVNSINPDLLCKVDLLINGYIREVKGNNFPFDVLEIIQEIYLVQATLDEYSQYCSDVIGLDGSHA